jgi:hypothetical protein
MQTSCVADVCRSEILKSTEVKKLTLIADKNMPKSRDFLWRYYDVHKFLNLLHSKRFRFSRMDKFEDPLEGIPLKTLLAYRTKIDPDLVQGLSLSEIILDEQLRDFFPSSFQGKLNSIHAIQKTAFITCWFAEQRESLAMWNLYSNPDGVALKIPFRKLLSNLNVTEEGVSAFYGGMVEYLDLNKMYKGPTLKVQQMKVALRKDSSFKHECEFRFVVQLRDHHNELTGFDSEPIDLHQLGMKVVCHPRMAQWKRGNIKTLLEQCGLENAYEESIITLR